MSSLSCPAPYRMCSEEECKDRQAANEVSEFEATRDTFRSRRRIIDPSLAVTKYRRSAAGRTEQFPRRSLEQLSDTWKHISTSLVFHQHVHSEQKPQALSKIVAFVDDRIRAIQVELVISRQQSSKLQLEFVRYHLLTLYLLSEVSRKIFEPKFSCQALMTAMVAYWNDNDSTDDNDDEILCYATLCQVAANIIKEEGNSWLNAGEIFELYRKYRKGPTFHHCQYPQFVKAVQIAAAAHREEYARVLKLAFDNLDTLGRICLAPCLNKLRWLSLLQYNKAFMKREMISPEDIGRLLRFENPSDVLNFCSEAALPIDNESNKVIFKAGVPMKELETYAIHRKSDDWFCLRRKKEDDDFRLDEDKVEIPPHFLLKQFIIPN